MDARVCLRARRWAVAVLRRRLRRSSCVRSVVIAALIVSTFSAQLPAQPPAWVLPPASLASASSEPIRLTPPVDGQSIFPVTRFDQPAVGELTTSDPRQSIGVDDASIVPWRTTENSQPAPPPMALNGVLQASLQKGPSYSDADPVRSSAEPLPAPGGVTLPTIAGDATADVESVEPQFERPGYLARCFGPGIYAGGELLSNVPFDYKNFYSLRSLAWLGGGVGIAAIVANTSADQSFQDWYDGKIKSQTSDRIVDDIRWMGRGHIMIPIFVTAGLVLTPFEDRWPLAQGVGQWGRRTTRSLLVGGPMLLTLQYAIGSYRPRREIDSDWHPFRTTNGVSGDAFIAGIVFFSAAKQVENPLAKGALYVAATVPAWGRINDDGHYLSQAFLGVWLAAVAVAAVDRTDRNTTTFVVPYAERGVVGGRVGWRW